jgi:RHS repeat-associated protein
MRREASSFYHYNHLGTALALTGADEAVSDTYRHDAWGVLLERTGSTVNPHTYVGRERYYRMPNAAMYHLGFRDYAQGVGRFTTVDPAHAEKNFFAYASNRPVVGIDPSGLLSLPPWIDWILPGPSGPPPGTCVRINCDEWFQTTGKAIGKPLVGGINWCVDQFVSVGECETSCMNVMRLLRENLDIYTAPPGTPPPEPRLRPPGTADAPWPAPWTPWPPEPVDQHPLYRTCIAGCWAGRNAFALACTAITAAATATAATLANTIYALCVATYGHGDVWIHMPESPEQET